MAAIVPVSVWFLDDRGFCGCCGGVCGEAEWCATCAAHIAPALPGVPPWRRTYQAQYAKPCPQQAPDRAPGR